MFAKDSSLPPVIIFNTEELEDTEKDRDREREVRERLPSLVSVSLRG